MNHASPNPGRARGAGAGVLKQGGHMSLDSTAKQKNLREAELHVVAEVVSEMARAVANPFSTHDRALTIARAARKDTALMTALTLLHRNIMVRRKIDPHHMLAPLAPLFHKLELEAAKVLSRSPPRPESTRALRGYDLGSLAVRCKEMIDQLLREEADKRKGNTARPFRGFNSR